MKNRKTISALIILIIGIIFVLLGICRGEPFVIFNKATKICLECIGIG
ncbi:MAG: thioredoxin [Spirochaetaceae bacterium]|nr:thioredoxin [Spirochaetaceae bacterium]